jgi:hypothetical protein
MGAINGIYVNWDANMNESDLQAVDEELKVLHLSKIKLEQIAEAVRTGKSAKSVVQLDAELQATLPALIGVKIAFGDRCTIIAKGLQVMYSFSVY